MRTLKLQKRESVNNSEPESSHHNQSNTDVENKPTTETGTPLFLDKSVESPIPFQKQQTGASAEDNMGKNRLLNSRGDEPLKRLNGWLHNKPSGRSIPEYLRYQSEQMTGRSLEQARLHKGPEIESLLDDFNNPAIAFGNHILLSGRPAPAERGAILQHELGHVAQAQVAAPDLNRPLEPGSIAAEGDVHQSINTRTVPKLRTNPNVVYGYLGMGDLSQQLAEQRERARRRHQRWERSHEDRYRDDIGRQSQTIGGDIQQTEQMMTIQRGALFQGHADIESFIGEHFSDIAGDSSPSHAPAELRQVWGNARSAVDLLNTCLSVGEVDEDTAQITRAAFVAFYTSFLPFALDVEVNQLERQQREERAAAERRRRREQQPRISYGYLGVGDLSQYTEPPPYDAPESVVGDLQTRLLEIYRADSTDQWQTVITGFNTSTRSMDSMLLYFLPADSEARRGFEYAQNLSRRQQTFQDAHPEAVKIQATFYPRDEFVDVQNGDGNTESVAKGIPWLLYLYREGTEWVLIDLMSPQQKTNRYPVTFSQAMAIGRGDQDIGDPPKELFEELNSRLRFPEGQLYWNMPSGTIWTLETTEPWTLSTWLTAIGIGLAALGLIFLTCGAGTPAAIAFGASALVGIGATLAEWNERSEQGMLTDRDVGIGILAIVADIASVMTLGFSKIASVSVQAGRLARLAVFAGRYLVYLRTADILINAGQFIVVTSEFIRQYQVINNNRALSEQEREQALGRLVITGMLTTGIMMISLRSDIQEIAGGRRVQLDVDADGNPRLRADDDMPRVHTDTPDRLPGRVEGAEPESAASRPRNSEENLDQLRSRQHPSGSAGDHWDWDQFPDAPGRRWQPGDPINMHDTRGNYPAYGTARGRYWRNRAHFELEARRRGETVMDETNVHDQVRRMTDEELIGMVASSRPLSPRHPVTGRAMELEHTGVPQRVTRRLSELRDTNGERVFTEHEARLLTETSNPGRLLEVEPLEHAFFDGYAQMGPRLNRPVPGRLGLDGQTFDHTLASDVRLSRPLSEMSDDNLNQIVTQARTRGADFDSSTRLQDFRDQINDEILERGLGGALL